MNEVEGHYSFWQYRNWLHRKKKKKKGGKRKKEESEYSKRLYGQLICQWMAKF